VCLRLRHPVLPPRSETGDHGRASQKGGRDPWGCPCRGHVTGASWLRAMSSPVLHSSSVHYSSCGAQTHPLVSAWWQHLVHTMTRLCQGTDTSQHARAAGTSGLFTIMFLESPADVSNPATKSKQPHEPLSDLECKPSLHEPEIPAAVMEGNSLHPELQCPAPRRGCPANLSHLCLPADPMNNTVVLFLVQMQCHLLTLVGLQQVLTAPLKSMWHSNFRKQSLVKSLLCLICIGSQPSLKGAVFGVPCSSGLWIVSSDYKKIIT